MESERIDLAHEADFAIGPLRVHPSSREVERDGKREVIEPRVMQVLVALSRANGAVLSKDDLTLSCWDGRVVGEDAINRVISRLRRLESGLAKGLFHVETVTRVGYRLRKTDAAPSDGATGLQSESRFALGRRSAMIGAAALAVSAGLVAYRSREPDLPDELADMIDKAHAALNYNTPEQNEAAVAIMREAVRQFPDRAEPWGVLALAYRQQGVNSRQLEARVTMNRSLAAARRALDLNRGNADGAVVLAVGYGLWSNSYGDYDRKTRQALQRFPRHDLARRARASFLTETGQVTKAIAVGASLVDPQLPLPYTAAHAIRLWSAGRGEEAEALLDVLIDRWPRHYSVWSTRLKFLLFSGKLAKAEDMLRKPPVGLEAIDIAIWEAQLRAIESDDERLTDAALAMFDDMASTVPTKAQEAVLFAAQVARPDRVFGYLDLYYRTAGYIRAYRKARSGEQTFAHSGCMTFFLFEPPLHRVRADSRFIALVERLGLAAYWRAAKASPDFARNVIITS